MTRFLFFAILAFVLPLGVLPAAHAAEGDTPGWYFDADLGGVWTGGNSESNTLGVGAKLQRVWPKTTLTFRGAATQTQSTLITRQATGTTTDYTISEDKQTEKTAQFYNVMAGLQHDLSKRFFAFGGVDWMRNRFAGIDDRTLIAAGAGNTWKDNDKTKFDTYYSFTYTFQTDVVENPFVSSDFPGVQLGYLYETDVSNSTRFESALVADWNLDNTDDVRVDWFNSLPVSISSKLELKPTLRLLWRNTPSLTDVSLYDTGGAPTGETVTTPLAKLDSIFTLALVVKLGPSPDAE